MTEAKEMEGSIFTYRHHNGKRASVVLLQCETDFCARTSRFSALGNAIAMHLVTSEYETMDDLMAEDLVTEDGITVGAALEEARKDLGEKVEIIEAHRFWLA